jgi:hypothetical protein
MANRRFDKDRCQAVKFDRCHSASFKITKLVLPKEAAREAGRAPINLKTARCLDVIAPQTLLATAAEVVD